MRFVVCFSYLGPLVCFTLGFCFYVFPLVYFEFGCQYLQTTSANDCVERLVFERDVKLYSVTAQFIPHPQTMTGAARLLLVRYDTISFRSQ